MQGIILRLSDASKETFYQAMFTETPHKFNVWICIPRYQNTLFFKWQNASPNLVNIFHTAEGKNITIDGKYILSSVLKVLHKEEWLMFLKTSTHYTDVKATSLFGFVSTNPGPTGDSLLNFEDHYSSGLLFQK